MLDIEPICEAVHKAYCDERLRQSKKAYWTGGDYSKLDEATKNYDRATVQAVLKYIGHKQLQAEIKRLNELVFAYESVEAPVNPLLADNKRLERELTCANEECGGLQENVERLERELIQRVDEAQALKEK